MTNSEEIKKLRETFKSFVLIKLGYYFDRGKFDNAIKDFTKGDNLIIKIDVDLLANDVIFMKTLSGVKIDKLTLEKVKRMWDKENNF